METIRFIYPLIRPHLREYLAGILLIPLSTFCALSIPRLTGRAVDLMKSQPAQLEPLYELGVWILLFAIGRGAGLFSTRYLIIGASRKMEYHLRNKLFAHLQSLDRPFYDSARTGDLMNRATVDVEATRLVAGPAIMYSIGTLFMLSLALPLMVSVDLVLTLSVMVPLSLLPLAVRFIGPRVQNSYRRAQETLAEVSSFAQESCGGIRIVKSFAIEDRQVKTFSQLCDTYHDRNMTTERLSNWMHPLVGAVSHLAVILLLVVGGYKILDGSLTLGEFFQFSGYQAMLIWPMISIGWVVNQMFRGVASVARLKEIFSRRSTVIRPELEGRPTGGAKIKDPADVEFRNLSFSYGNGSVLENINITVQAGKTVALIGRTGAGKSTLVQLIPRLYPVPDGTLFVGGVDVNEIPLKELRRSIGFVPQETFLFSRTIAQNIAFGVSTDATDRAESDYIEDVEHFCRVARLDKDFDQFISGVHELVGERGVTLSGGQRQRVSIARALLLRPRILILDDALSAVDTHTEEELVHNLREVTENLTVFIISHRISSIKDADKIYVLDEGRIIEEGTHETLHRQGGLYEELYQLQLLEKELEEM